MLNPNKHPILIVDDDAFQRRMIRIKLQTRGYEVNEAKDGVEALGFVAEQTYSMILLDIVMPQLNGWEVLDQIRARDDGFEVPVIMMTAKDNEYDPEAARKRGASDYLTKPIDFALLDARIDEYVGNGADSDTAASDDSPEPPDSVTDAGNQPETTAVEAENDTLRKPRLQPVHSLLDGMLRNLPGVFFRAIGDADHNVHMSFESDGINTFLGQAWSGVPEIFASLERHDRREVNRQFRDLGKALKPILLRFPCKTRAGRLGWVECRATPHRLPSGETVWDAMLLDVTKQKELELKLIRAREAAADNPAPEHLPLLEMYRRYHAAALADEPTDALAENINDLERALVEAHAEPDHDHDATVPGLAMDNLPDQDYRDASGYIHQCAQCRKVQNFSADGTWELVPEWTHAMPLKTNHTICVVCSAAEEALTTE